MESGAGLAAAAVCDEGVPGLRSSGCKASVWREDAGGNEKAPTGWPRLRGLQGELCVWGKYTYCGPPVNT